ncbi:MAG: hypothetical protein HYX27_21560 [Acidobacteria bacterium]|nr:hypothetical protein [Acidobacteriota bacterium]
MKPWEEKNFDVLQNLEFQIVEAYRANPAVTDFDVTDALDALCRQYSAEMAERRTGEIAMDPRAQAVYQNVRVVCEWRLGRTTQGDQNPPPITLPEVVAALRTIMKSVKRWSERGGKRGYLDFVKNYLP